MCILTRPHSPPPTYTRARHHHHPLRLSDQTTNLSALGLRGCAVWHAGHDEFYTGAVPASQPRQQVLCLLYPNCTGPMCSLCSCCALVCGAPASPTACRLTALFSPSFLFCLGVGIVLGGGEVSRARPFRPHSNSPNDLVSVGTPLVFLFGWPRSIVAMCSSRQRKAFAV